MLPISVCMIAKNEEQNISKCLAPLKELGFELVIADTGSTDRTIELASQYTKNIYSYSWQNDFSAARNFIISKATNDWILVVDFDEYLEDYDMESIKSFLAHHTKEIGTITRRNPCQLLTGQSSIMTELVARFFNRKFHHYEGIIHEQVFPIDGSEPVYQSIPMCFYHQGYDEPNVTKQKAERNLNLLLLALKTQPDDPYLLYQIGKCYQVIKDYPSACDYFDAGLSKDINPELAYVQDMIEAYGYCLLEKKDYATALGLSAVYDLFAHNAEFVFLMGLIYMNNALFEQAIAEFQKATTMKSCKIEGTNSYLANYNIGVIYECMGQEDKAMLYYNQCNTTMPIKQNPADNIKEG